MTVYVCSGLCVAGLVRVNSCIVCGERVLAVVQKGGSLIEAASESLDWSASLRPGSHLYANICAAEIYTFDSFLFPFGMIQSLPLLIPNMRWFAWLLCRWYRNLNSIVWAYVEWLGSPGLFILRCEVYILPFLSALCLLFHSWLPYFSYYLWDNSCNAYIVSDLLGEFMLSSNQMFHCNQKYLPIQWNCWWI